MSTKKKAVKSKAQSQRSKYHVEKKTTYRITLNGPLAEALHSLHESMQSSRKFRKIAASDIHELARECLDRGMLELEREVENELGEADFMEEGVTPIRGSYP